MLSPVFEMPLLIMTFALIAFRPACLRRSQLALRLGGPPLA